jgi:hypothetical protein
VWPQREQWFVVLVGYQINSKITLVLNCWVGPREFFMLAFKHPPQPLPYRHPGG